MNFATAISSLSWEFYNIFFDVLIKYGIIYLPLVIYLYQHWFSEDMLFLDANTNRTIISCQKMFISVITYFFIIYLALFPVVPLKVVNDIKISNPLPTYDSKFNKAVQTHIEKLSVRKEGSERVEIKLPLLWVSMEIFAHVANNAFLSVLPKTAGDVRAAIANAIANSSIKDLDTKDKYNNFYNECYLPALGKLQYLKKHSPKPKLKNASRGWWDSSPELKDYDWVGGKYYLTTKGFYKPCKKGEECYEDKNAKSPAGFSINAVNCDKLWNDRNGLRENLITELKINDRPRLPTAAGLKNIVIDNIIRNTLSTNYNNIQVPNNLQASLSDFSIFSFNSWVNLIKYAFTIFGAWIAEVILELVTTAVVAFLPLAQAITLAFFVIILPIAMIISALRVSTLITFLMFFWSVSFLTIIWAVVAFIDHNIMNIMAGLTGEGFGSGTAETAAQIISHTTLTGSLISIATTYMYYQATTRWFKMMHFAGAKGTLEADGAMNSFNETGGKVGGQAKSIGSKIIKK